MGQIGAGGLRVTVTDIASRIAFEVVSPTVARELHKDGADALWVRALVDEGVRKALIQMDQKRQRAEEALRKIAAEVGDFRQSDYDAIVEIEHIIEKWVNS